MTRLTSTPHSSLGSADSADEEIQGIGVVYTALRNLKGYERRTRNTYKYNKERERN